MVKTQDTSMFISQFTGTATLHKVSESEELLKAININYEKSSINLTVSNKRYNLFIYKIDFSTRRVSTAHLVEVPRIAK